MYLTPEYKYAVDGDGEGYMLFERGPDPEEQTNLIGHPEYGDVERELRDGLLAFYQDSTYRYRRSREGFKVSPD